MFAIALDGPAGAGKSTVAQLAAKQLGMHYVDTGAMYRTLAYHILQNGTDVKEEEAVAAALAPVEVEIRYDGGIQKMFLAGEEVTGRIRTAEVGEAASIIAAYRSVREKLLKLQRELAERYEVIMDGRDIGTAILPEAALKIYLTADARERGKRRFLELEEKEPGKHSLEKIIQEIQERDERDMNRRIAPLRKAEDAVVLDTTHMSAREAAEEVVRLAGRVRK